MIAVSKHGKMMGEREGEGAERVDGAKAGSKSGSVNPAAIWVKMTVR